MAKVCYTSGVITPAYSSPDMAKIYASSGMTKATDQGYNFIYLVSLIMSASSLWFSISLGVFKLSSSSVSNTNG
jgi:hypothetical protein